jgi:hypothetical protein
MAEDDDNTKCDYQVGFRKPPKHSQFVKGRSGNPAGRPKGTKNFPTIFEAELDVRVPVTENGKRKNITKRHAIVKQMVNKAASGDFRSASLILNEWHGSEARKEKKGTDHSGLSDADHLAISHIAKILGNTPTKPAEDVSGKPGNDLKIGGTNDADT